MSSTFVTELFDEEPAGTFLHGYVFLAAPDITGADGQTGVGYWHCDIEDQNRLTWSEKVYELFGLTAGSPIDREWAVARYCEQSKSNLHRVREYALSHEYGFILDAEIRPEGEASRWIRVLAVPIVNDARIVGLHGLKRAL